MLTSITLAIGQVVHEWSPSLFSLSVYCSCFMSSTHRVVCVSIHDARTCKIRTANNLRHDVQHIYNNIYLYLPNSILLTVTYTVVKPMKCAMLLLNVKACLYIGLVLPSSGAVLCIQVWCYCLGTGVPRYSAGGIHSSYVHVCVRGTYRSQCACTSNGSRELHHSSHIYQCKHIYSTRMALRKWLWVLLMNILTRTVNT